MNKKAATWMAGLLLGTTLYGADTSAAPNDPPPPLSPCVSPPLASDCGNPDYLKVCPARATECDTMNKRLAAEESRPKRGVVQTPTKLYATPGELGFADALRQDNYGILASPYTQSVYRSPKAWNPKMKRRGQRVRAIAPNTQHRWAAQEIKWKTAALGWTPQPGIIGMLTTYQRPHDATSNLVGSCEDYVYKGFQDDERWLDAIYGCKGNARCEVDVSLLPASPGIARRTLTNPLMPSFQEFVPDYDGRLEFRGKMPKNAFYAGTGSFLPDSLVAAFGADPANAARKQSVQALVDTIKNQLSTYDVGGGHKGFQVGAKVQGFSDEWDFHEVMNQRTAAITPGEFDEYKRRSDLVLAAMDNFYSVAKCASSPLACTDIPSAVGRVKPGEAQMFEADPFVARAVFGNVDPGNATNMLAFVNAHAGMLDTLKAGAHIGGGLAFPGLANRNAVTQGSPLLQVGAAAPSIAMHAQIAPGHGGSLAPGNIVVRSGVRLKMQESPGVNNDGLFYLQNAWRLNPPKIDTSVPYPRLLCRPRASNRVTTPATRWSAPPPAQTESFVGEVAACEAVNVLLEEWAKKTTPGRGPTCFDATNYACDWSPDMFVKRWVTNSLGYSMQAKERAYSECRDWRTTLFASGKLLRDPVQIKAAIGNAEVQRGKDLEGLPVKQVDDFGQDKRNNETWGNKAFGVGYAYDLGWEAKIFRRFSAAEAVAAKDAKLEGVPCRMGGRTHASFEAFAYAFGLPPFDIVAADFGLDVNDDKNQQQTDALTAYGHGEFIEAYEFYKIPDGTTFPLNQASAKPLYGKHDGDQETIAVIPVQITWVTLTFTIGIAWGYGADIIAIAQAPNKDSCTTNALFQIGGAVKPDAHLDLVVGADCSVAGIAGVGVDVDLVLLDIGLPIHGGASLLAHGDAKLFLQFDAGLDMTLGTLDGHMDAYAKFLGIKLFEVELFHWKGFHTDIPLFHFKSREFPLFDLGAHPVDPSAAKDQGPQGGLPRPD